MAKTSTERSRQCRNLKRKIKEFLERRKALKAETAGITVLKSSIEQSRECLRKTGEDPQLVKRTTKSPGQSVREYRARQKALKAEAEAKTSTERTRECRLREKQGLVPVKQTPKSTGQSVQEYRAMPNALKAECSVITIAKTSTERTRECRLRKKQALALLNQTSKSFHQGMREYRDRKECATNNNPISNKLQIINASEPIASNFPIAVEEIKIEKEVLQETTIKSIPSLQNDIKNESIEGALYSWYEPSCDSFVTQSRSNSHFDYSPSFYNKYNLPNTKTHSTKIERRKTRVQKSFNSMKKLMDATAKGDRFAIFGKYIAQKLCTSNKDIAEINIAKLLIDNVLQNLTFYNSDCTK